MLIETFVVGMLSTNCYIVGSDQTKDAIIIDPGLDYPSEAQRIFDYISKRALNVRLIVNTHGHQDHTSGNSTIQEKYNVPIYIHKYDVAFIEGLSKIQAPNPVLLEDGGMIKFGDESLTVLHTPGHTPGSICLVGEKLVFTGDTLFAMGIGRTDFPEGSMNDMQNSLERLKHLPDYFLIYPGHGPSSIMGEEKRANPFLSDENSF